MNRNAQHKLKSVLWAMVYPCLLDKLVENKIKEAKTKIVAEVLPSLIDTLQILHVWVTEKTKGAILMVKEIKMRELLYDDRY